MSAFFLADPKKMLMQQMKFEVFGRVQQVNFRHCTKLRAQELAVVGWVRNTSNGTVTGVAEGSENSVQDLKHWLSKIGSPGSRIEHFKESTIQIDKPSFDVFRIVN